jgi:hypothetical protein
MKQFNIAIARDAARVLFTYKKRNPASASGDYFDNASITAASVKVINTETDATILASTAMSYSSAIRGWRYAWTYGTALDGVTAITVEVIPTRAGGVSATLTPIDSEEFEVADTLQRIDELPSAATVADAVWDEAAGGHSMAGTFGKLGQDTKTAVDTLRADFDSFEAVNQGEHDATQSAVAQIGATARTQLIGPTTFAIPDSGSTTFVLDWVGKDTDASPTILDDPDSNIVDVTVADQSGGTPAGVTLGGTPVGRMTRNSLGRYQLVVTTASTAVDGIQLRFFAASTNGGAADVAMWTTTLGDFDQLDSIQAQVDAIRTTDVPAIQSNVDSAESAINANVDAAEAAIIADVDAEHGTTRALVSAEAAAIDADLAAIKGSGFATVTDSLKAVSDTADAVNALVAALQTALSAFEATVKSTTAGSYDRDTDSLEALRERLNDAIVEVQRRIAIHLT